MKTVPALYQSRCDSIKISILLWKWIYFYLAPDRHINAKLNYASDCTGFNQIIFRRELYTKLYYWSTHETQDEMWTEFVEANKLMFEEYYMLLKNYR